MSKQDGRSRITSSEGVDDNGLSYLHIDLDAFFASVEELDNPDLRGKPIIVGGTGGRGVVSTANYVARKFGVNSAMPMQTALKRCPHAVVFPARFSRYQELSEQVFQIVNRFTPNIRRVSIDEAYCDVSGALGLFGSPTIIAKEIRKAIETEIGLTASIGIGSSMFVAKVAGSLAKPNGMLAIPISQVKSTLGGLTVAYLFGVGPVTRSRLEKFGFQTVSDIQNADLETLKAAVGERLALRLSNLANGVDNSSISHQTADKTISNSETFWKDVTDPIELRRQVMHMANKVSARARKIGVLAHTVSLTVRFADWRTKNKSVTLGTPTAASKIINTKATEMLNTVGINGDAVRLVGIRLENLIGKADSAFLWDDESDGSEIDKTVDAVVEKFGGQSITKASLIRRISKK